MRHPAARRRRHAQRGMSESVQWALLAPLVMACLCGLIQLAVWSHGRAVVQSAAIAGAETYALFGGDEGQARDSVRAILNSAQIHASSIVVDLRDGWVEVTVQAHVTSIMPQRWSQVEARATRAKEF